MECSPHTVGELVVSAAWWQAEYLPWALAECWHPELVVANPQWESGQPLCEERKTSDGERMSKT